MPFVLQKTLFSGWRLFTLQTTKSVTIFRSNSSTWIGWNRNLSVPHQVKCWVEDGSPSYWPEPSFDNVPFGFGYLVSSLCRL